jgi:acyl-CoA thioester hydrolase
MPSELDPIYSIQNPDSQSIENWFIYPIRVQPHHTDYAGIVWHGSYVAWMEEARVECLRSFGVDYADWVAMGCDLPVVELSIRYHQSLRMGMAARIKTRMQQMQGVRIYWDYEIQSPDGQELYVTAQVTLVPLNRETGKVMRRLPPDVKAVLAKIAPG